MTMIQKDNRNLMSVVDYMKSLSKKTISEIWYIRNDAHDALKAFPEGKNAEFYSLEVAMCTVELNARSMSVRLEHLV